jgi:CrcB protein
VRGFVLVPSRSELVAVFSGGCLGALARAGTAELIPGVWATLLVNVVGAFILGVVFTRSPRFLGTGFCGALTTFSTLSTQLLALSPAEAVAYAVGSVVLGYLAVDLGRRV